MKKNQRVMTPNGAAVVTEIHAKGKSVKVEMLGKMNGNGVMVWPQPFIQTFNIKQLSRVV